jgi:glycosyltransferase involved in cell wall biosynthesis
VPRNELQQKSVMSVLSICIPTYNRAEVLDVSLRSLCQALRDNRLENAIEVCVSDNGSSDHTPQVLVDICREFPKIRQRRNSQNLGFGRNLWNVIRFAQSDYVVPVGDDDMIAVETIADICSALDRFKPNLLLLSSDSSHLSAELKRAGPEPRRIDDLNRYLTDLGAFHATFIGNLVFKRKAFLDVPEGKFIADSAYPHMVPVLACLKCGDVPFLPIRLAWPDDTHRSWRHLQPVYTSIDLAQIFACFGLTIQRCSLQRRIRLILFLARSLPKAYRLAYSGEVILDATNPYQSLDLRNVLTIYFRLLWPNMKQSTGIRVRRLETK